MGIRPGALNCLKEVSLHIIASFLERKDFCREYPGLT